MDMPRSKTSIGLGAGVLAVVLSFVLAITQLPLLQAAGLLIGGLVCCVLVWELRRSQRRLMAEHAAHVAKSLYLANMSHELRTPLNAIIGFSELMRMQVMGPLENEKYAEYAGDIHDTASHLLDLINDVLDLSRLEAGQLVLHDTPTDVGDVLASCHRLLRERARRAGLSLQMEIAPDLPEVMCDPAKLRQIMLNLVTNAVKFTPRGGKVTVTACLAEGELELAVEDTGCGIAPRDIPRVLTPFVQAAHTYTLSPEGTGLGLPLSKRLIELHGGRLRLDSALGEGTRVSVSLPHSRLLGVPARQHKIAFAEQAVAA